MVLKNKIPDNFAMSGIYCIFALNLNNNYKNLNKMKLIKCSATWCNPCRLQHTEFENNPIVGAELVEVDIEEDTEIAEKYLIKSIPTMLLLDDNDNVIHKWIGYTKSADINKFIAEL